MRLRKGSYQKWILTIKHGFFSMNLSIITNKLIFHVQWGSIWFQKGWTKWSSQGHWDMHANSAAAVQPDWYSRRVENISRSSRKYTHHWVYDRWGKPSSFNALGLTRPYTDSENNDTCILTRELGTEVPRKIKAGIPTVRYPRFLPELFASPTRGPEVPPLVDSKHMLYR